MTNTQYQFASESMSEIYDLAHNAKDYNLRINAAFAFSEFADDITIENEIEMLWEQYNGLPSESEIMEAYSVYGEIKKLIGE